MTFAEDEVGDSRLAQAVAFIVDMNLPQVSDTVDVSYTTKRDHFVQQLPSSLLLENIAAITDAFACWFDMRLEEMEEELTNWPSTFINVEQVIDAAHSISFAEAIHEVLLSVQGKAEENGEDVSFNDAVLTKIAENFVALRPALSEANQTLLPVEADFCEILDVLNAVARNLHTRTEMLMNNFEDVSDMLENVVLVNHKNGQVFALSSACRRFVVRNLHVCSKEPFLRFICITTEDWQRS